MRKFESIFILKPDVTEEQVTNVLEDIKKIVDVRKEEKYGKKKLAYPVQNQHEGYYVLFEFQKANNNHDELEKYYKNSELIIKSIIVALD